MGLVAGMGGSMAFFFLLGTIDRRTYGASQLPTFGTGDIPPCLGVLPDLGASMKDPETSDIASHCVHQIRNQIEAVRQPQGSEGGAYVLAISSPFQGDGKTSIIMALGWSYAAAGYNTLLIDCDMVGRSLTRQLGLTGREGLKEALVHKQLNGGVSRMPIANLSAVPVGVDARFGPENVRRIDLERLVSQIRDQYDIILVDTGPLLGSLESTPVMAIADGVVLSVRRGRSRTKLEDCITRLKMVGAECIGVILNCAARNDCNRYVSEASLAAAEEERRGRASKGGAPSAGEHRQPGERNILVKAVQNTTRSRALPSPPSHMDDASDMEANPRQE
jgi:Mrp family chromosome partitioning ATPase